MTFDELMELRVQHLNNLRRDVSTVWNHRLALQDFVRFCRDELMLTELNQLQPHHFAAYITALKAQPLTALVQYSRQRQVRTSLAWAVFQGYLFVDPSKDFTWKHPPLLPKGALTETQILSILATPDDSKEGRRDRAMMELLYGTGVRLAECMALNIDDLDFQAAVLQIRRGKNGQPRTLPLGPKLVRVLKAYLEDVRPLFTGHHLPALWLSRRGKRMHKQSAYQRIRAWAKTVGLDIGPHAFRHALATHLLARGAPLVSIQRLLGHVTMSMTTRYTHLIPRDTQQAVLKYHPRARKRRPGKSRNA